MLIPDYQNILRHLSGSQSDMAFWKNMILKTYTDKNKAEFNLALSGILNDSETSPRFFRLVPYPCSIWNQSPEILINIYPSPAICSKNKNIIP